MESATYLGATSDQVALINNWHMDTRYVSSTSGDPVSITANIGVRQGCVAAPTLWNMYIHSFLILLEGVFSKDWVKERLTVYADDFHISLSSIQRRICR